MSTQLSPEALEILRRHGANALQDAVIILRELGLTANQIHTIVRRTLAR